MAATLARLNPTPPNETGWTPVRSHSVANQIVVQVREALFAGGLSPGDALGSEKDLAASFGVSRITVRDALRALETMGIVEIRVGEAFRALPDRPLGGAVVLRLHREVPADGLHR